MTPSPKLHTLDLSLPSQKWIEMLLKNSDPRQALVSADGPKIFYSHEALEKLLESKNYFLCTLENSQSPSLLKNSAQHLTNLSKNPEHWLTQIKEFSNQASSCDTFVFYVENPNHADGTCLSQNWLQKLLSSFPRHPRMILLLDETLTAFQWSPSEDIARSLALSPDIQAHWHIYLCWQVSKLFKLNAEQNASVSQLALWPSSTPAKNQLKTASSAHASPLLWRLLQRDFSQEDETVRRRHLALRNLRTLADKLRPLIESQKIKVPFWPFAGAWVEIECLQQSWGQSEILSRRLAAWGLKISPQHTLSISYLHETKDFEENLTEVVNILQKTP